MKKFPPQILAIPLLVAVWVVTMLAARTASAGVDPSQAGRNANSVPFAQMPTPAMDHSFVLLPSMSPNATPAEYGAQLYRLVCSACHGDVGQGLTDQWRSTWSQKDQNCWQSKCHSLNHPPDGFTLPQYVPPVKGANILYLFPTALDLHDYIQANMPWQNKGSLAEKEYWELTSFLLQLNGIDPGTQLLDAKSAAEIVLRPGEATPTVRPGQQPGAFLPSWWWLGIPAVLIALAVVVILVLRARK